MIQLSFNLKSFLKEHFLYLDSLTKCRLRSLFKAIYLGYDLYPAYCSFRSLSFFDENEYVVIKKEHKNSIIRNYCKENYPISIMLKELQCKDIDDLTIELINSDKFRYEEILRNAPYQHTLWLYEYLRCYGDLRLADFIRQQSLHAVIERQRKINYLSIKALSAMFEMRLYEDVIKFIKDKNCYKLNNVVVSEFSALSYACLGEHSVSCNIWETLLSKEDKIFYQIIAGKDIAVVGPSIPNGFVAEEIDSHDLVVRANFNPNKKLPYDVFGSRTDLTYCNQNYPLQKVMKELNEIKFITFFKEKMNIEYSNYYGDGRVNSRVNFKFSNLFYTGFSNAIPNIIFDLLHFSPRKVKVYCSNFFTSKQRVHEKYQSADRTYGVVNNILRRHDFMSNFILCKNLFKANLFDGDSLIVDTLSLDRYAYLDLVSNIFNTDK